MFQIYHSNQLDLLKDLLVALMRQNPLENPFDNETILVQSPGMAQWLQLQIAQSTGIASNINFPLPASFIWSQFKAVLDEVPQSSPFNKTSMTWLIMKLLPTLIKLDDFAPLLHYLEDDLLLRKHFQLSQKIADIFDQYLVYRPEWIDAWEKSSEQEISTWSEDNGQSIPLWIGEQRWQPILWKKLSAAIENQFSDAGKVYHRAELYKDFLSKLAGEKSLKHLPKRIFVFGISALPESYLQALLGLAKHCDVHFLLSNPCSYYWADIADPKLLAKRFAASRPKLSVVDGALLPLEDSSWQKDEAHRLWAMSGDIESEVGNPLLASMGKMGRDFLYQLYSLNQQEVDAFVEIERDNLLHHLQADILALQDSSSPLSLTACERTVIDADDHSLTIHLAHSVMREVEILHDNLLTMFANDASLTPKDIIVMMPNIDLYAPYVQAVFSSADSELKIPFTVSDLSAQQENPILVSFLQLLNLNQSRYTREDILALLEVPAILQHFKLTQNDFVLLQKWINESGIRWGLHEQSALQWDLPELSQNSWIFGLKRMLLGYAMGDCMFAGISPYDEVQGSQGLILGRFIDFIDSLIELEETLQQPHDVTQWQAFIYLLIDTFYLEDETNSELFSFIREQLDSLVEVTAQVSFDAPLSLPVLLEYLQGNLNNLANSQRFLAGQVNFCTLMPMRSIPFKVVCLLGMNDGEYPRTVVPMGFDLMAGHRKRGDRSRRDEDRYLFLEALLSAQDKLYISYIGANISDNSERMASVLLSELLNYCAQSFVLQENLNDNSLLAEKSLMDFLHFHYPMQSFSEQYYKGSLSTYKQQWWQALQNREVHSGVGSSVENKVEAENRVITLDSPLVEVQLSSLKQFLKDPCKTFFNQRLDVYFDVDQNEQDPDEPFSLDSLQQYFLKNQQFEYALEGKSLTSLFTEIKAAGELPLGEFAPLIFDKDLQSMLDLASLVQAYYVGEIETVNIDISFTDKHLSGELSDHCENGLVRIKTGGIKGKDILALWVDHLCYCIAHGTHLNSTLFGQANGIYFEEVPSDFAYRKLTELIELYEQGLQTPLPFFIQSAFGWCAEVNSEQNDCFVLADLDPKARAAGQKVALEIFNNSRGFAEGSDPYISRVVDNLEDIWPQFEEIAFKIFKPILTNISTIEYEEFQEQS